MKKGKWSHEKVEVYRYWEKKPTGLSSFKDNWVHFKHDHFFDVMDRRGRKIYRDLDIFDLDDLARRYAREAIRHGKAGNGKKPVRLLLTVTEKRREMYVKKGGRLDRDKRYDGPEAVFDPSPLELEELKRKKEIYMVDRIIAGRSDVLQQSFEQILSSPREVRSLFTEEERLFAGASEEEKSGNKKRK